MQYCFRKRLWGRNRGICTEQTGNLQSSFQNQHPIHDRQLLPELFNNLEGTHEMSSKTQIMKHEAVLQLFWCFPFMPCKQIKCLIVIERSLFGPELWLETGLCRDCKNIQNTGNQNKPMNAALKSINKVWMMFDNTKIRWNRCLSIWTLVYWLVLRHMHKIFTFLFYNWKRNVLVDEVL